MEKEEVTARLDAIAAEIQGIEGSGLVIAGARLELARAGGTARGTAPRAPKYGRLVWGRGKERRSRYVPLKELDAIAAAVDRGRAIAALEKERDRLLKRIS